MKAFDYERRNSVLLGVIDPGWSRESFWPAV